MIYNWIRDFFFHKLNKKKQEVLKLQWEKARLEDKLRILKENSYDE